MPWHFGGPEELTFGEVEAYIEDYRKDQSAEEKQVRDARKPTRAQRR